MQCDAFDGRPGFYACRAYECPATEAGGDSSSPPGACTQSPISALVLRMIAGEPADCRASRLRS